MAIDHFLEKTTRFLANKKPFFFIVNFDKSQMHAFTFDQALEKNGAIGT